MFCHAHRWVFAGLLVSLGFGWVSSADAQILEKFVHNMARDAKRNNCWPQPFVCPDRQRVRAAFVQMVANGWERQNLLSTHHFKSTDGQLNESGRLRIHWILTEAPPQHRTIFVQRGPSAEETAARVDRVQQVAMQLSPDGELPRVVQTSVSPLGWPAERVDVIGRKFHASMPDPRLPCGGGGEVD